MQRIDIMRLKFRGLSEIVRRAEFAAMPQYLALELGFFATERNRSNMGMGIKIAIPDGYFNIVQSYDGRYISAANA